MFDRASNRTFDGAFDRAFDRTCDPVEYSMGRSMERSMGCMPQCSQSDVPRRPVRALDLPRHSLLATPLPSSRRAPPPPLHPRRPPSPMVRACTPRLLRTKCPTLSALRSNARAERASCASGACAALPSRTALFSSSASRIWVAVSAALRKTIRSFCFGIWPGWSFILGGRGRPMQCGSGNWGAKPR